MRSSTYRVRVKAKALTCYSSRSETPVHNLGIPVLGRVAGNRVFFLPPPPYPGFGRPPVRGRKIKLNDARTLPKIDTQDEWELEGSGSI